MKKTEFLKNLRANLRGLPKHEIEERISFFSEMIDDRTEEGLSEDEAVLAVSKKITKEELCKQTSGDGEKRGKKKLSGAELAIIIAGSPVWFSLGAAAVAVIISLYAAFWAVIASFWAAFASFAIAAPAAIISAFAFFLNGFNFQGFVLFSAAPICLGLAIFSFLGCLYLTKWGAVISKNICISIKRIFCKKEEKK